MIELAGVEVQPVRCGVVAKFFAVEQLAGVATVQLAVGRAVLVTAIDRIVSKH